MKEAITSKVEVDLVTQIRSLDTLLENQWKLTAREYTFLLREQQELIDELAQYAGYHTWQV